MISSRSIARSVPRAVSRFTISAIRRPAAFPVSIFHSPCAPSRLPFRAAFSTTLNTRKKAGDGDEELIQKFASEIQLEKEMKSDDSMPTSVKDYIQNGPFKVIDTPGNEEVVLTRDFGNEKIRVAFSISDLNAMDSDPDYADRAMGDEEDVNAESSNQGVKQIAQDAVNAAESEQEEGSGNGEEQSFPSQLNITIEKPQGGALLVEATAQDGMIIIDNVCFYKSVEHALAKTPAKSFERDDMYVGPPFGNLDEGLQVMIERYLDERGINAALAVFVPDYMDMKEQKEYEGWLKKVKVSLRHRWSFLVEA